MKKLLLLAIISVAAISYTKAQVAVNINAGFNIGPRHGVVYAQPVYRRPAPVVYAYPPPAPVVYVAPRPVYYAPAPVYVERRGYYGHGYHRGRGFGRGYGHGRH